MNFQQLRIIRETVKRNFNLTDVANALYTSQSGVSKHIKDLEDELGVELFVRRGKRLLGLTEPGRELVGIVERILLDTQNIKKLGEQFANKDRGQLDVATTHTQARYALPHVVAKFRNAFPNVHLVLHQGSPTEIARMLADGTADIGIATESLQDAPELVSFPYYTWHHGVIVKAGHALEQEDKLTLDALAEWPLITYSEGFTGRPKIDKSFADAGIVPDIVLSALDADVIKAYVELGLGVGIVASQAFDPVRDPQLRLLDATHLFQENVSRIAVRRGAYLRGYAYRFIEYCAPTLTEPVVRASIEATAETGRV
ncbi:MAG: CysB family HTH-type transcriptional regulator [Hyphomicrobium zavarzinii]|jgi:LysR family cys regulon transcriptional activator|uniref:CysB family HTH-type transcriptional regulator n=1 Tax=Hyphomicrobium zavarzinii TaxID=48292 RepID=UPI0003663A87|nr:CysB family HTH-type transcriptional regulator [Hyphomicrobium zavarzinii]MBL8846056.1 CysB family HTH-type transcriptional regulator [Hyphomicrobium zavarzinii]HML41589.1 CysB family HTH-type transcriptional regulator [Hyphomicrobium zavarzinii]